MSEYTLCTFYWVTEYEVSMHQCSKKKDKITEYMFIIDTCSISKKPINKHCRELNFTLINKNNFAIV